MEYQGVGNASLPRQGSSFYSLTLDEVQSRLGNPGKPIGSLNIDEFLRTVCQVFRYLGILVRRQLRRFGRIFKQGKMIRKDENENQEGQNTSGEVAQEDIWNAIDDASNSNAQMSQYQMHPVDQMPAILPMIMPSQQIQQQTITASRGLAFGDSAYLDTSMSSSALMGPPSDTQAPVRNRTGETLDKKEKRKKKHRESVARSRKKKQAYTQELEMKVSLLEEENARLRKPKEFDEKFPPPTEPRYQLRRTSSASF